LAGWIAAGESGAVVGLPGTGRATFLNVLCRRPEIIQRRLDSHRRQAVFVPVDLNNLPDNNLATLYRVILRSFYEIQEHFDKPLRETAVRLYEKYEAARDPFLPQSGLRELLLKFEEDEKQVVLVMNRFDRFCQTATPRMTWTLRGLRDSFKGTLCYIMGMGQEVTYFSDLPSVEPLYSILDTHVCWIGPLGRQDALEMIQRETRFAPLPANEEIQESIFSLTGGYPSLVRVVCHWWLETAGKKWPAASWPERLLSQQNVRHRLNALFESLTSEEQALLRIGEQQKRTRETGANQEQEKVIMAGLVKKGIGVGSAQSGVVIAGMLAAYARQAPGESRGRIWENELTGQLYQGKEPIADLAPLERSVLQLFIKRPHHLCTYTELAIGAWPDDVNVAGGVSPEAIQQVISGLRKRIEPDHSQPRYVISWRGKPEGGYQFFPEGRPK
jgi:DNA-binding response OmpR family regulator